MYARYEIVQVIEGRLFDEDCYERTGSFETTLETQSGYYAVLWPSEQVAPRSSARLLGPFPDARFAAAQAEELLLDLAAAERAAQSRCVSHVRAGVADRRES
jgi:hypothetical protein